MKGTKLGAPGPKEFPSWMVALAGAVSLGVAMGIGRFSFTPILPLMIRDGLVELQFGSSLASANYLGYLAGAMLCMGLPRVWPSGTLVRVALSLTVVLTLGMVVHNEVLWLILRFVAGAVSAIGFVHTSRWCLTLLAKRGSLSLGSLIFVGVGLGIALSGLAVAGMAALGWASSSTWIGFGALGILLVALTWPIFGREAPPELHHRSHAAGHKSSEKE
ncbi:YbfB/YjiJ family MFS transporter, partial [Achromobacter xylosoxidans]